MIYCGFITYVRATYMTIIANNGKGETEAHYYEVLKLYVKYITPLKGRLR